MSFDPKLPQDGHNVSGSHPLREAVVLLAAVTAGAAGLVLVAGLAVNWLVPLLPPALEARVFSALPGGGDGVEDEGAEVRALAELLARLDRHWADDPYELHVVLWEQKEPNAMALPGGWIAVTRGLLDAATSENELAFVLGHELGHFRDRDHLRGLGRGVALALLSAAIGRSGAGSAAQLATLAGVLAGRGYDRAQEREADRFGLGLVAAEYGHVAGAADFFAHLPHPEDRLGERVTGYLSTHPGNADRARALDEIAERAGWAREGELAPLPQALRREARGDAASVPP